MSWDPYNKKMRIYEDLKASFNIRLHKSSKQKLYHMSQSFVNSNLKVKIWKGDYNKIKEISQESWINMVIE